MRNGARLHLRGSRVLRQERNGRFTSGHHSRSLAFIAKVLEHKQADRGGQIALFARLVDPCNKLGQGRLLSARDIFQVMPEGVFKTDTGLVPIDDDRTFDN